MNRVRMVNYDSKVLKKKKIDKELNLKVTQNEMSGRIFVEFSSEDGKLVTQKSFQNTFEGKKEAEAFQKRFKSLNDLKKYFGINKEKEDVIK
jgi:hypothetical protein